MKTFNMKLLTIFITLAFGIPVFCFGQTDSELNRPENGILADSLSYNKITVYTCSMHPEIQTDKPGYCPKCGMKLVINTSSVNSNNDQQNKMDMKMMCMPMDDMNHTKEKAHPNSMIIVMGTIMAAMMVIMLVLLTGR